MPAYGNKLHEKYDLEAAQKIMERAIEIIQEDEDICFESEVITKLYFEQKLAPSTYQHILNNRFKVELEVFKKVIDSLLEARCAKTKKMYPGIAAMALKNKHKWRDRTEIEQTTTNIELTEEERQEKIAKLIERHSSE